MLSTQFRLFVGLDRERGLAASVDKTTVPNGWNHSVRAISRDGSLWKITTSRSDHSSAGTSDRACEATIKVADSGIAIGPFSKLIDDGAVPPGPMLRH